MTKTSLKSKSPQKLKRKLDILFSKLIRERDSKQPCIDLCGKKGTKQAGHFRRRELMMTRWDYRNVNGQNAYCNAFDNDTYRHAKGIDERWGSGTAKELDKLSRLEAHWSAQELELLISAAKKGYPVFKDAYDLFR